MQIDEEIEELSKQTAEQLAKAIVNASLNEFVGEYADDEDAPHGKRIPYVGWYWRSTDFANRDIPIGDCGAFVGVMENNKWDYPQRNLTKEEADQVIAIIYEARHESKMNAEAKLRELWELFQTFEINQ